MEKGFGRRRGMKGRWEVSKFEFTGRDGKWVVEKRGRGRTKMVSFNTNLILLVFSNTQ